MVTPINPYGEVKFKASKVVALLIVSAAVAVGLIGTGGYTMYANMRHTERERGWVDHSQAVLSNLQVQAQRLDHVDLSLQLYAATGDRSSLKAADAALASMGLGAMQLQELVKDNASGARYVQELDKELEALTASVGRMQWQNRTAPDDEILACRNTLSVMQQEERTLLRDRTDLSKASSARSFVLSILCLSFSMTIVVVLFVFLFRDTMRRWQDEQRLFAAKGELEATVRKLTARAEESGLLTSARDEMQLCTTAQQAHESTVRHMSLLLPETSGATLTIDNSRRMVEIVARWGETKMLLDGFNPDACCGLRAGKARWRKLGRSELHCGHFVGNPPENYLCLPLAAHGETQGFVFLSCDTERALELAEERTPLIQQMVELASLSIASLNLRAKLEGQSIRDGLTGLFNRHFMEIALERELHRAARQRTSLAVLMMDVDHFKLLNDTYGHEAGDLVLREVAECFRRELRQEDIICRYGGEEFVVIMPDATEETALRRAEMIRGAVLEVRTQFRGEALWPTTISVGIAMYPEAERDGGNLIRLADTAMYRAKQAGRNRVMLESSTVVA